MMQPANTPPQTVASPATTLRASRPFCRFEWMIALRYLRARRREGIISIIAGFSFLGIMTGVATLIIVMAVMNGFRGELMDKILGFDGHFTLYGASGPIENYAAMADRVKKVAGVSAVIPYVEGQIMVVSANATTGALVRGIRLRDLPKIQGIVNDRLQGSLEGFDHSNGVIVGSRLAQAHNIHPGDSITLISPEGPVTPFGVAPRMQSFPVSAIFNSGMSQYDQTMVFMPFALAKAYFARKGASAIEIMVKDPDRIADYEAALQEAAGPAVRLVSWVDANATFFNALNVERNVMFLILTLIILIAALNIVSGLTILVKDKTADIAILRSMGATRGAILRIFLIAGAAIGIIGTLAGLLLGVVFCDHIEAIRSFIATATNSELFSPEIYYLSHLPADMDHGETVIIVAMSIVLSLLSTFYPAWRAARLDPAEALRHA